MKFSVAEKSVSTNGSGDRQSKMKVIHELFFPCRMGLLEAGGVGSLPLTAAQCAAKLFPL